MTKFGHFIFSIFSKNALAYLFLASAYYSQTAKGATKNENGSQRYGPRRGPYQKTTSAHDKRHAAQQSRNLGALFVARSYARGRRNGACRNVVFLDGESTEKDVFSQKMQE